MTAPNQHILHAYEFDGQGSGKPLVGGDISQKIREDVLAWVHLDAGHPDTRRWLEEETAYLDPLIIEALLAEETRPRLEEFEDGVLMILRGVNLNENADPEDMVSIRMWIDPHRIISLRLRRLKAVQDMREKLLQGKGPKNAGSFIGQLVTTLTGRMEPVMAALDEAIDDVEEEVMQEPDIALRSKIIRLRSQAIILRRHISPQRDVISRLRLLDYDWISKQDRRQFQENYDRITRYVEDLDTIRERAQIVQDELTNVLADRLNRNMYVLSVVAAIFLPLSFLTGLLGINVGGIPGAENPDAFAIFGGIMVVIVILQVTIFRKLRWF